MQVVLYSEHSDHCGFNMTALDHFIAQTFMAKTRHKLLSCLKAC